METKADLQEKGLEISNVVKGSLKGQNLRRAKSLKP